MRNKYLNKTLSISVYISIIICINIIIGESLLRILPFDFSFVPVNKITNDHQFSNTSNQEKPEPFRILVLGDSFCVTNFSFPFLMAKKIPINVEIINMSESGIGPDTYLEFYKLKGKKFKPDLVILSFYVGNDILNLLDWVKSPYKERIKHFFGSYSKLYHLIRLSYSKIRYGFFKPRQGPLHNQPVIEPEENTLKAVNPFLKQEARQYPSLMKDNLFISTKSINNAWGVFENILQKLLNDLDKEMPLLLLSIPDAAQVNKEYHDFYEKLGFIIDEEMLVSKLPQQKLQELTLKHNIDLLDVLPDFRVNDKGTFYLKNDNHLNERGHEYLNEIIVNHLYKKGYIPMT